MVGLVNVPMIVDELVPDNPPVMPPVTIGVDQLYKVPDGIIPLVPSVGVMLKLDPLQITAVNALTVAFGFTVTVNANTAPVQLPDTGVTK